MDNKVIFTRSAAGRNLIASYKKSIFKFENSPWILDLGRPNFILESYSNLFIREGYKLIGYLLYGSSGSNGYVYAISNDSSPLPPDEYNGGDDEFSKRPRPEDALPSFMMSIDGDRSPFSYLQAAILYHELCEYGASWHGVSWGRDVILPIDPYCKKMEDYEWDMVENYEWNMYEEEPKIINPHFYYDENNGPTIVFYTINDIGTVTLNEYKHTFDFEDYSLKLIKRAIGDAGTGIIF